MTKVGTVHVEVKPVLNDDALAAVEARIRARVDAALQQKPSLAKNYEVGPKGGLLIDGRPFPWWIEQQGPLIDSESSTSPIHILWVPVLIDSPAPATGNPPASAATLAKD